MVRLALPCRPDVVAYRLGFRPPIRLGLHMANRYQDAYLLYQPYTFQNNAPFRKESATSWALGVTFPLAGLQPQPGEYRAGQAEHRPSPGSSLRGSSVA